MVEYILLDVAIIIVLGIGAQWLAWRFKLPSILLLLVFGFLAGPVTGLIHPELLRGDGLFPLVGLAVGIILFEAGLSLRLHELKEVGRPVLNLITLGVLVTWVLAAAAAYLLAGFNASISLVIGALLTVTGPTVVIPLLRMVRPTGRVGTIAKWEGITIDPIGAILAVLVLNAVLFMHDPAHRESGFGGAVLHVLSGLLHEVFIGLVIGTAGALFLLVLLRRHLLPDPLENPVTLMTVVAVFAGSNVLGEEAGLLATTLMGIVLANQRYVSVRRIVEFKEDLRVLLLSLLFIVLSARLELSALAFIGTGSFLFLAALMLVVRPVTVFVSSLGTGLAWREQAFLAWLAPRGIVAAAVASLFSVRLHELFPAQAEGIVPVMFLVIIGTVAAYGLTIVPVARALGLAQPSPQGVLIVGAHPWAQQIARALQDEGMKVLLIDANAKNVLLARQRGLPAHRANALAENVVDELDLSGIGRLIALTPNDEVNALAALHFRELFERTNLYQVAVRSDQERDLEGDLPLHLRGRVLFGLDQTFAHLAERFNAGARIEGFRLSDQFTITDFNGAYGDRATPLFLVRPPNQLFLFSNENNPTPIAGDKIIALVDPEEEQGRRRPAAGINFEALVLRAPVLDLSTDASFDEIAQEVARQLGAHLGVNPDRLADGFRETSVHGVLPITGGAALPHYRTSGVAEPELALVRCHHGITVSQEPPDAGATPDGDGPETEGSDAARAGAPIHALIFLVSPRDNPSQHLYMLANIATRIDEPDFSERWLAASDEQELKEALLHPQRHLALQVRPESRGGLLAGRSAGAVEHDLQATVALLRRDGRVFVPERSTVLQEGDRVTLVGTPDDLRRLSRRLRTGRP